MPGSINQTITRRSTGISSCRCFVTMATMHGYRQRSVISQKHSQHENSCFWCHNHRDLLLHAPSA